MTTPEQKPMTAAQIAHKINWLPAAKKLSSYLESFKLDVHPTTLELWLERECEPEVTAALAQQQAELDRLREEKEAAESALEGIYPYVTAAGDDKRQADAIESADKILLGRLNPRG